LAVWRSPARCFLPVRPQQGQFRAGPFLLFASLLSIFHQLDMLPWSIMLPLLIIVFGGLLLGAFILRLKMPESLQIADRDDPGK
jgi:hypothetical protein